jgi:hypothetical protein
MRKENLLISFSGGRTSACMTYWLLNNMQHKYKMVVMFANTGKEREETLEFIKECDDKLRFGTIWIESVQNHNQRKTPDFRIVNFETANRTGAPFEDMIKKHGIPNTVFKTCSRELKHYPIKNFIKKSLKWKKYKIALGIRIDEPIRLTPKDHVIYPFAHLHPMTKLMVNQWWHNQPFNLRLKDYEGNCDMCWKKSKRKLLTIIVEHPEYAQWWNEMEIKYGNFVPPTQAKGRVTPITFFREKESAAELIEDSQDEFKLATDAFTLEELMFSDPNLDFTDGCAESCEPF